MPDGRTEPPAVDEMKHRGSDAHSPDLPNQELAIVTSAARARTRTEPKNFMMDSQAQSAMPTMAWR